MIAFLFMFFSIECNMSTKSFPKYDLIDDNIISIVVKDKLTYLLTTYETNKIDDTTVIKVDNEKELLIKFMELIMEIKPEYIIGYNILMFDNIYITHRIKLLNLYELFNENGFHFNKEIKRFAFGDQERHSISYKNSKTVSIYDNIKENIDLPNYSFSHVCKELLNKEVDMLPGDFYYNAKYKSIDELTMMSKKMIEQINIKCKLFNKYFEV